TDSRGGGGRLPGAPPSPLAAGGVGGARGGLLRIPARRARAPRRERSAVPPPPGPVRRLPPHDRDRGAPGPVTGGPGRVRGREQPAARPNEPAQSVRHPAGFPPLPRASAVDRPRSQRQRRVSAGLPVVDDPALHYLARR